MRSLSFLSQIASWLVHFSNSFSKQDLSKYELMEFNKYTNRSREMKKENIIDSENSDTQSHLPSGIKKRVRQAAAIRKGYLITIFSLSLLLAFLGSEFLMFFTQAGAKCRIISFIIAPAIILTIAVISVSIYNDFRKVDDLFRKVSKKTEDRGKNR